MLLHLLGWIAVVTIAVLSLIPGELRPHTGAMQHLEHFLAYFLTAATLAVAYERRLRAMTLFVCLVIYAGALEIAQLWVPGRLARSADFFAGTIGIIVGIVFINLIQWIAYRRMR